MKTISKIVVSITILISTFFYFNYGKESYTFYGDALGYYSFLPSAFIYHNFEKIDSLPTDKGIDEQIINGVKGFVNYGPPSEKGFHMNQYTVGVALMELPFFVLAHGYEFVRGFPLNGYSTNYHYAIKLCAFVYSLIGLLFTFLVLIRFVSKDVARITVSLLLIGTNLFWFTFHQAGMAHIPIFMLFAIVIWSTLKLHDNPKFKYFILLGFASGFIALIRPSDLILLLFPFLYLVYDKSSLSNKLIFLYENKIKIVIAILFFALPIIPQLIFWKTYTGHFIYDGYHGQGFTWSFKYLPKGLFSSNNGWLFYSPIMIFSLVGYLFFRKFKSVFLSLIIIFPIYIFVIYSWWCYTYINGLGSRPMIHLYPLLAIPFAIFISWLFEQKKKWLISLFLMICSVFVYSNYAWSRHEALGYLYSEHTHKYYSLSLLTKLKPNYRDNVTADLGYQPYSNDLKIEKVLAYEDFNDSTLQFSTPDDSIKGNYFIKLQVGNEFLPKSISIPFDEQVTPRKSWIRCSGRFLSKSDWVDTYSTPVFVFEINRGDSAVQWLSTKIVNKIGREHEVNGIQVHSGVKDKWGEVFFYAQIPKYTKDGDIIRFSVWDMSKEELWVDDLKMELCSPKN